MTSGDVEEAKRLAMYRYTTMQAGPISSHDHLSAQRDAYAEGWTAGRAPLEAALAEARALLARWDAAADSKARGEAPYDPPEWWESHIHMIRRQRDGLLNDWRAEMAKNREMAEALREIANAWTHEGSPAPFCPHCVAERALGGGDAGQED